MRTLRYLALAVLAATLASPVLSCEKAAAAGETPCPHAKAAQAEGGKPCAKPCAGEKAGAPCPYEKTAKADCPHAKGDKAAMKDCPKAGTADCPMLKEQVTKAFQAETAQKVSLTGTVVCAHCDLKKAEKCQPMFKDASGHLYTLWMDEKGKELKGGCGVEKKSVTVSGKVAKVEETEYLGVDSFKI